MYVQPSFKTKKDLKDAVANGQTVTVYAPGIGAPPINGETSVEGPSFRPHTWYASVTIKDGKVIRVK